jgi:acyl-coenzyme A thioesterase PaaI-like protein
VTTNARRRARVATALRELGHEFVAREPGDRELEILADGVERMLASLRAEPLRRRAIPLGDLDAYRMPVPAEGAVTHHELFADSVVSGHANPMGLGADLWREGDTAVMRVTLGKAFEGAPGRSHGGVVAALIDETMGVVMGIHDALGFTAQLDITYLAPTPINEPITARAWLERRDGRKMHSRATVQAGDVVVAEASALFITVATREFLERLTDPRSPRVEPPSP